MTQKPKNLPAFILDMPNEEYHRGEWSRDFVSSTQLKNLLISPKAFDYLRRIGGVEISLEASMKGSVYHAILASIANTGCLDEFESEYFVFEPPINPTTGAAYGISSQKYQIAYQQALAEHPGMEATSQAEVDLANTMVEALLHHCGNTSESISQLLEWGTAEISHFVEYEGLGFKFRTDLKTSRKIVDWKTISSKDLHEETITSQINKMNYGFSAAFYQFFNHLATGEWAEFYWVFQQKEPPYDAVIVSADAWAYCKLDDESPVYKGASAIEFENALEQYIKCSKSGYYPGAEVFIQPNLKGRRVMNLNVPTYKRNNIRTFYSK